MSPGPAPLVSIGMPVRNSEATLDAAIQSILNQTLSNWEFLVLDDGSEDETVRIAQSYRDSRICVLSDGTRLGLAERLNHAIGLSRGRYFARMDGDDVSYPERLALQVDYLKKNPEIDLVGGGVVVFGRNGRLLGKHNAPTAHECICRRPWRGFRLAHPTWMGKTEWFRKHLYCAQALRCEDQELLLRSHETSRFAAVPEIVLGYREEELSIGKILSGRRHFAAALVRRAIRRGEYWIGMAAVAEQALKGLADSVAISTGLNYRLLRHRAIPLVEKPAERRWNEVWKELRINRNPSTRSEEPHAVAFETR